MVSVYLQCLLTHILGPVRVERSQSVLEHAEVLLKLPRC